MRPKSESSAEPPAPGSAATRIEDGPLSASDFELLERAGKRSRVLRRAVLLAHVNGISLFACALACLPLMLFDSSALWALLVLGPCALVELRGARMLQALDLRAPRWLTLNQFALLAAVALYCAVHIVTGLRGTSGLDDLTSAHPDLADPLRDAVQNLGAGGLAIDSVYSGFIVAFYLVLLVASALYLGGCAYYYATRAPVLRAHVEQTPAWVLEAERRLHA